MQEELRDIKGVIYIFDWGTALFFVFLALLLAGLGYFLFKRLRQWRGSRKAAEKESAIADRPFNEIALEALMRIDPVEYFEKRKIKEFYFEVYARNPDGSLLLTRMNETGLRQISSLSEGAYYMVADEGKMKEIFSGIDKMEKSKFTANDVFIFEEHFGRLYCY